MNTKYIWLLLIFLGFTACNDEEDILADYNVESSSDEVLPELIAGSADFSKFVSLGASFTAGFTDNALFIAAQENSFPNILSQKFSLIGGGSFTQPLMSDNFGGLAYGGFRITEPRLVFGGAGPVALESIIGPVTVSTDIAFNNPTGPFNNMGVPGAKSFHLLSNSYGDIAGVGSYSNPYFVRMASGPGASMLGDAVAQNPTFFTISEIAGNDVLSYATSGGTGVNQAGNFDPSTYGSNDITDPNVFGQAFNATVASLAANGANGVVANIPYITNLPHFTTVKHNELMPSNPDFGPLIPTLNGVFGQLNLVYAYLQSVGAITNAAERSIVFSTTEPSAFVIIDETLIDISAQITAVLSASPDFAGLLQSFGLPTDPLTVGTVATLFGATYGQSRQATADDLVVLSSSPILGEVNTTTYTTLLGYGLPALLAGQFSVEGITNPLADKWVLLPSEQDEIIMATDAFNVIISDAADANGLAFVDFKAILEEAYASGISAGDYLLTTDLVMGGLVGLDGIHLTARGYAVMANEFMKSIDVTYGSNFEASGNFVDIGDYPTNYHPTLQ